MAIQLINIGQIANDGTGDDLREAMIKINQNFEELDLRDDEETTASNLGDVGEGLFANLLNYDLQFKKIAGGDNITLAADDEKIVINASNVLTDITVNSDNGSVVLENSAVITIAGGVNISTDIVNNILTITNDYIAELSEDITPQLGGDLDGQGFNITNVNSVTSTFIGSLFADDSTLLIDSANKSAFIGNLSLIGNIINSVVGETEIRSPTNLVLAPNDNIWISSGTKLIFEGTVPDNFEAKLQATVVTADRDIILPDEDGTLATREWVNNVQQFDTDIKGSVFGDDSTLLVDGVNSTIPASVINGTLTNNLVGNVTGNTNGTHTGNVTGNLTGDIKGSVYYDDSTQIIDAVAGRIVNPIVQGPAVFEDNVTLNQDLIISGNLFVQGATTNIETTNTTITDNIIVLNEGEVGAGVTATTSGIEIDRGSETNKTFVWNDSIDKWSIGTETLVAGTFEGNVTGLVNGVDPSVAAYYFNNIDLGSVGTINNIIDLIVASTEISLGTFTSPAPFAIDLGSF